MVLCSDGLYTAFIMPLCLPPYTVVYCLTISLKKIISSAILSFCCLYNSRLEAMLEPRLPFIMPAALPALPTTLLSQSLSAFERRYSKVYKNITEVN